MKFNLEYDIAVASEINFLIEQTMTVNILPVLFSKKGLQRKYHYCICISRELTMKT